MKKNTQVLPKIPQEVLQNQSMLESLQETPQHLSAEKPARTATVTKRLAPPALATLISLINKVPAGLPPLRELRIIARESSNAELGLRGPMAYGESDRLDRLIFREIEKMPRSLREQFPDPPAMSDPHSRLPWISRGINNWSRARLYYCYDYSIEGKVALDAIADGNGMSIGPFRFEIHLDEDAEGKLKIHPHPILEALEGVERIRIRRCPICAKIYWAERKDQPTCSKKCNNVRRTRIQRGTFPQPDKVAKC